MIWQHVSHSNWYFCFLSRHLLQNPSWMAISLPDLTKFLRGSDQPVAEVPS